MDNEIKEEYQTFNRENLHTLTVEIVSLRQGQRHDVCITIQGCVYI